MNKMGRLADASMEALCSELMSAPPGQALRLFGDGMSIWVTHLGDGGCRVSENNRKLKDRMGERLIRWGYLERERLLSLLALVGDGDPLDLRSEVGDEVFDNVLAIQGLDSIDRLALNPQLEYEFCDGKESVRGYRTTLDGFQTRFDWAQKNHRSFLSWRAALSRVKFQMVGNVDEVMPGASAAREHISSVTDLLDLQPVLRLPVFDIALALETLQSEGVLLAIKPDAQIKTIQKSLRTSWFIHGFFICLSAVLIWFSQQRILEIPVRVSTWVADLDSEYQREWLKGRIVFAAEKHFEIHSRYPESSKLVEILREIGVEEVPSTLSYVTTGRDFVIRDSETERGVIVSED